MMMERGEMLCYGPPARLLEENEHFAGLIKKAGFKDEALKGLWKD